MRGMKTTLVMVVLAMIAAGSAGAQSTTGTISGRVVDAQNLLDLINFDGTGSYLESKVKTPVLIARRNQALQLANTLDQYNNGNLCP